MNCGEMTVAILQTTDGGPVEAIRELLRSMLEKKLVSAVLVAKEIPSKKTAVHTLVKDPAGLDAANPLAPVFSVNAARIIAKMCAGRVVGAAAGPIDTVDQQQDSDADEPTAESDQQPPETPADDDEQQEAPAEAEQPDAAAPEQPPEVDEDQGAQAPIAVVVKPCEARAIVELAKLQQVDLDPFLIIGIDCYGTFSVQDYAAKASECSPDSSVTADFLKQVSAGDAPEDLRNACLTCRFPAAPHADLAIHLIGEDISQQIRLQACTEKGEQVLQGLGLEATPDSEQREEALGKLKEAREKLAGELEPLDFLEMISSLCINCRNCRSVCPICYCKQCVFEGDVFEYPLEKYLSWSGKRGALGMPPDKLLFHLTRMSHVATSCVACGQCEAACPSGIPLGRIYQMISAAAQQALEYEAGRSLDDELPLTTFREEELSMVEN